MKTGDAGNMEFNTRGEQRSFQNKSSLYSWEQENQPFPEGCLTYVFCHKTKETNSLPYPLDSISEVFSFDSLGCLIDKYVENQARNNTKKGNYQLLGKQKVALKRSVTIVFYNGPVVNNFFSYS